MTIDWDIVFRGTVIGVVFLVTLIEFLKGGSPWPFLVFTIWALVLVVVLGLGVLR